MQEQPTLEALKKNFDAYTEIWGGDLIGNLESLFNPESNKLEEMIKNAIIEADKEAVDEQKRKDLINGADSGKSVYDLQNDLNNAANELSKLTKGSDEYNNTVAVYNDALSAY